MVLTHLCQFRSRTEVTKFLRLSGERLHAEQCRDADLSVEQLHCREPDPAKVSFLLKCVKRRISS
jgi:hypothetical protein